MRTQHWIFAVLAVAAIGSAQAYALTATHRTEAHQEAAGASTSDADLGNVPDAQMPDSPLPQMIIAETRPQAPSETQTLIVGFKNGLGPKVHEALVRAAGAVPTETVPGPETIVATIDRSNLDAAVEQLEANLLVDYVAVAAEDAAGTTTSTLLP